MADRTSAAIFGRLFEELAKPGEMDKAKLAVWLWEQKETGGYDFSNYQMSADEALVKLRLAGKCASVIAGRPCATVVYGPPTVEGDVYACDECVEYAR